MRKPSPCALPAPVPGLNPNPWRAPPVPRPAKGPLVHLGRFILQAQRPQPVGNEVLDFQVVRGGGFQLARLHQGLLVGDAASLELVDQRVKGFFILPVAAETTVLGGLASFGVIEGFDGEGERGR